MFKSTSNTLDIHDNNNPPKKKLALGMNNQNRVAFANLTNTTTQNTNIAVKKENSAFRFNPPPSFTNHTDNNNNNNHHHVKSTSSGALHNFHSKSQVDYMEIEEQKENICNHTIVTKEDLIFDDDELEEVTMDQSTQSLNFSITPLCDPYDIDFGDTEDPSFCSEYVKEIFSYLKQRESNPRDRPHPNYLDSQTEIRDRHRSTLVDWMVDVAYKFELASDTLLMAINYMDRYLSHKNVQKSKVQLVGTTALMIAAKYEEIYCPEVNDYIWITAKAYTKEEFLKMEKDILVDLQFELIYPTSLQFLRRFSKAAESEPKTHTLSKYFCELSILDSFFLKYKPSEIAAAAVFISKAMLDVPLNEIWTPTVRYHTGFELEDIAPIIYHFNSLHQSIPNGPYQAIYKKYSSHKFMGIALTLPLSSLKL